jgi:teichuronic acid biosynthesis glycosyltransferase TuaC
VTLLVESTHTTIDMKTVRPENSFAPRSRVVDTQNGNETGSVQTDDGAGLRVLVLSHMFPTSCNSTSGLFVLEQVKALRTLGVEMVTITPIPWPPPFLHFLPRVKKFLSVPLQATIDGLFVEYPRVPTLPGGRLFYLEGLFQYLSVRRLVGRYIKHKKIDLIHAHTIMPDGFAAMLLGREFGLPVVCTVHGSDISFYPHRNRPTLWATKAALKRIRHMVTVSSDLKQKIFSMTGISQVEVIPNGADPRTFQPVNKVEARRKLDLPLDKKIVLFVGHLIEVKGVDYLLRAMCRLREKQASLFLVGEGNLRSSLVAMSRDLGLEEKCTFVGERPHDEIPLWLCAADCLVLSSLSEGLPTILVEAMFCNTPIVATDVGGVREIIDDGRTGLLVRSKEPLEIAHAIQRLLNNAEFASHLAEQARSDAMDRLSWKTNATRMLGVYRAVTVDSVMIA